MRFARIPLVIALLAVAVVGLTAGCGSPQPSGIAGRLTRLDFFGHVVGLENGSVVVRPAGGGEPLAEVQSAHNGRYSVALPPGRYAVEIYADWHIGLPSVTEKVTVHEGEVTKLDPVRSQNAMTESRRGAQPALRRELRRWAKEVALARQTVQVALYGAHAGDAAALVGATGLPDDAHVYVVVLSGKTTPESPSTPETDALRHGGQIAYLVDPRSFAILRTRVLDRPASEDELRALGGLGEGFFVY
jgi:hypothetical protein